MTVTKQNAQYFKSIRHLHRLIAPIMMLPLLPTAITGTVYQILDLAGKEDNFKWILGWHKGHFESVNLDMIYPFFNDLYRLKMRCLKNNGLGLRSSYKNVGGVR